MTPFVESSDIRGDRDALRSRADRDGYLFFRNLVDREAILEARRDIATVLQEEGWIDASTDPFEAITHHHAVVSGMDEFKPVYDRVQRIESFHTLAFDAGITQIIESLLGPEVLLQPSNIARFIFPTLLEHTTPPHQDFPLIQGTERIWTTWLPLGDCPPTMGGLSVLSGSHKAGVLPMSRSLGAGRLRTHFEKIGGEWVSSPFELGDVLFFYSLTVHRGLPNNSGDRLRLSADFRFQPAADPVMRLVLAPHQGRITWEQVYENWKSDKYQYHWKKFALTPVAKEPVQVEEASGQGM